MQMAAVVVVAAAYLLKCHNDCFVCVSGFVSLTRSGRQTIFPCDKIIGQRGESRGPWGCEMSEG